MTDGSNPIASMMALAFLAQPAPAQDRTVPTPQPTYSVGDTVSADLKTVTKGYSGLDLPPLENGKCYVRTDEFIYIIDRETREVLKVQPVSDVLIW